LLPFTEVNEYFFAYCCNMLALLENYKLMCSV